jgi:hypothetical protein
MGESSKAVGLMPEGMVIKGERSGDVKGLVVRKRAVLILSAFILNPHFAALLSAILIPLLLSPPTPPLLLLVSRLGTHSRVLYSAAGLLSMMMMMMNWRVVSGGSARVTRPLLFQCFCLLALKLLISLVFYTIMILNTNNVFMFVFLDIRTKEADILYITIKMEFGYIPLKHKKDNRDNIEKEIKIELYLIIIYKIKYFFCLVMIDKI